MNPDNMHGACDGFGGQDTPHAPSAAKLRAEIEHIAQHGGDNMRSDLRAENLHLLQENRRMRRLIDEIESVNHDEYGACGDLRIAELIIEWRREA